MTELAPVLEKLVQYLTTVQTHKEWWSAEEVGAFLGVTARQVTDRYRHMPGFPVTRRLPSEAGYGPMRWKAKEIRQWMERQG